MKSLVLNKITETDIKNVFESEIINWEIFRDKTFYISGGTGVIGSFLIQCLLYANTQLSLNIKLVALVRNIKKAKMFFIEYKNNKCLKFTLGNVLNKIKYRPKIDYIIHCANNTSSKSFVENPAETFNITVQGTKNILDFSKLKKAESIVYLSSMEVYGNIDEPKPLKETDLGILDISDPRSSYPMGKRSAETLCYNYAKEYNSPVKVLRLAQIIGANANYNDSRVYAQFARSIVEKKDIILNTKAETTRSYCYITDMITALLIALTKGENGECYNIANKNATIKIKDMAKSLTDKYNTSKLIFDIKKDTPYFKETHWVLDSKKIENLNWKAKINLDDMYNKIIESFRLQR